MKKTCAVLIIGGWLGMYGMAQASLTAYSVNESDGVVGYHYGGSFGSWNVVDSSGDSATTYMSGSFQALYHYQSIVLEFNIQSLDALSVDDTASLNVNVLSATGADIYYGPGNGQLDSSDASGTLLYNNIAPAAGLTSFDVTSSILDAQANHYDWAKFVIRYDEAGTTSMSISTSEALDVSERPHIEVVPEPATLGLFIFGLGGLRLLRRFYGK